MIIYNEGEETPTEETPTEGTPETPAEEPQV
jgi:hypothetical protein